MKLKKITPEKVLIPPQKKTIRKKGELIIKVKSFFYNFLPNYSMKNN